MKPGKLAGIGVVLIIALAVVVALSAEQLMTTHAAGLTTKPVTSSKDVTPDATPVGNTAMPQGVPSQIMARIPAGNVLLAQIFGRGVLAFACPATAQSAEVPMIGLSKDAAGTQTIGVHFMDYTGLAWEGLNGDKVIAAPLTKVVINPNTAPMVLLQAQAHSGMGLFAQTNMIIRVPIAGGLPHPCKNAGNQAEEQSPFTTQYLLFGRPNAKWSW
jgi:hypothetical protein